MSIMLKGHYRIRKVMLHVFIPFEKITGVINTKRYISIHGYLFSLVFQLEEQNSEAKATPRTIEVLDVAKKIPMPWKSDKAWISNP